MKHAKSSHVKPIQAKTMYVPWYGTVEASGVLSRDWGFESNFLDEHTKHALWTS